jgi:hypothetical protein
MDNLIKTIIEYIKYILKLLIYFDTKIVQLGGAAVVATVAAPMIADAAKTAAGAALKGPAGNALKGAAGSALKGAAGSALKGAAGDALKGAAGDALKGAAGAPAATNGDPGAPPEEAPVDVEKELDKGDHENTIMWALNWIKNLLMSILKWFGVKASSIASTLLFASTAPILPFFVVMAGMYGTLKYFMYKLRRL